jgi:hypothetical protein
MAKNYLVTALLTSGRRLFDPFLAGLIKKNRGKDRADLSTGHINVESSLNTLSLESVSTSLS